MSDQPRRFCRRTFLFGAVSATVPVLTGRQADPRILMDPSDPAWKTKAPDQFRAHFQTTKDDFLIEVHRDWAPFGADRFYDLVRLGSMMISASRVSLPDT